MGGWVYRKVTLLVMVALAVTLSTATVASTAPPEKRVVCQDGVTKEVPIQAKAKGATEGPCEETPDPDAALAEELCRTLYGGEIIDSNYTCQLTGENTSYTQPDQTTVITGTSVYEVLWELDEPDRYAYDTTLIDIIVEECVDTSTEPPQPLPLDDPRCDSSGFITGA
jgi:hypothetical protein